MADKLNYIEQEVRNYVIEKSWERLQNGWTTSDPKELADQLFREDTARGALDWDMLRCDNDALQVVREDMDWIQEAVKGTALEACASREQIEAEPCKFTVELYRQVAASLFGRIPLFADLSRVDKTYKKETELARELRALAPVIREDEG
ncbi:MAG: hypothetical protein IJ657_06370 [Acidaminococcaceae bacterium]|nr:hypothetical protein [Acidaminococcaceae bacterium]